MNRRRHKKKHLPLPHRCSHRFRNAAEWHSRKPIQVIGYVSGRSRDLHPMEINEFN